jgi:hypothetical protein
VITLLETVELPADFPAEIYPQEYLGIFMRIWLYCGPFLRILPPQENPQVTVTFAEDFAAKMCWSLFLRICLIFIFLISS